MTYFDPNVYKKEEIKNEKDRGFIDGMEAVYDVIDTFVANKDFDLECEMEDGDMPTFTKIQKEALYATMNDFREWLEMEVMENVVSILDNEAVIEDDTEVE